VEFICSWFITSNTDTRLPSNTTARSASNFGLLVTMKVLPLAQDPRFLEIYVQAAYGKKIMTSELTKNSHAVIVKKITLATSTW
jgi:hypothetical protein